MKNKIGFILVKPQIGENIGACARSLKNFGFSKLHIISPKQSWPNNKTNKPTNNKHRANRYDQINYRAGTLLAVKFIHISINK